MSGRLAFCTRVAAIKNVFRGVLLARVAALANARGCLVQMQTGDGPWQDVGIFPQERHIELTNLMPGTMYGHPDAGDRRQHGL